MSGRLDGDNPTPTRTMSRRVTVALDDQQWRDLYILVRIGKAASLSALVRSAIDQMLDRHGPVEALAATIAHKSRELNVRLADGSAPGSYSNDSPEDRGTADDDPQRRRGSS